GRLARGGNRGVLAQHRGGGRSRKKGGGGAGPRPRRRPLVLLSSSPPLLLQPHPVVATPHRRQARMTRREVVEWLEAHPMDLAKMAQGLWPVRAGFITAEDAVQEGLRRVFETENYRALRSGVKITSWLMKSVASAARNAVDKRS